MIAFGNRVLQSIRKVQASTGAADGLLGPILLKKKIKRREREKETLKTIKLINY
jgi:hypothetical protein